MRTPLPAYSVPGICNPDCAPLAFRYRCSRDRAAAGRIRALSGAACSHVMHYGLERHRPCGCVISPARNGRFPRTKPKILFVIPGHYLPSPALRHWILLTCRAPQSSEDGHVALLPAQRLGLSRRPAAPARRSKEFLRVCRGRRITPAGRGPAEIPLAALAQRRRPVVLPRRPAPPGGRTTPDLRHAE